MMSRRWFPLAAWLLVAGAASLPGLGAGTPEAAPADDADASSAPLVTWSGGAIDGRDLASWQRVEDAAAEDRRVALTRLALLRSLADEAERAGLHRRPDVAFALERLENRLLARAYARDRSARLSVSDAEVDAALAAMPDAFRKGKRYKLRNIFKKKPSAADDHQIAALRARLEALRDELAAGAEFAELAFAESDSQTRFRKGIIGFVELSDLPPAVAEAVAQLAPGDLSPVIETAAGLTLLRCDKIAPAIAANPEEQRHKARRSLLQRKRRLAETSRKEALRAKASLALDLEALRDPESAPDTAVARFAGGTLTRAQLDQLGEPGSRNADRAERESRLRIFAEQHAEDVVAAGLARERGLADATLAEVFRWRRAEALATAYVDDLIAERREPLDRDQARAFFEANRKRFRRPARYDFSVIRLPVGDRADPRPVYRAAEALEQRLQAGEIAFADAARELSEHPRASQGGAVGWLSEKALTVQGPRLLRALQALAPGDVSRVVEQDDALWLLQLHAREPARALSFEEAAEAAEKTMVARRDMALRRAIEGEWMAALGLVFAD